MHQARIGKREEEREREIERKKERKKERDRNRKRETTEGDRVKETDTKKELNQELILDGGPDTAVRIKSQVNSFRLAI